VDHEVLELENSQLRHRAALSPLRSVTQKASVRSVDKTETYQGSNMLSASPTQMSPSQVTTVRDLRPATDCQLFKLRRSMDAAMRRCGAGPSRETEVKSL